MIKTKEKLNEEEELLIKEMGDMDPVKYVEEVMNPYTEEEAKRAMKADTVGQPHEHI